MKAFLDSSALAKRYINEPGSLRVNEILSSCSELGVSAFCVPEVVSALARRRREGLLNHKGYDQAKRSLLRDVADAYVVVLDDSLVRLAIKLLERFALRSLGALQIASALVWDADAFISADNRQSDAAEASGLHVQRLL